MKVSGGTRLNDMGGEDKEGKERDGLDILSRGPEFCSATGHQSYTPNGLWNGQLSKRKSATVSNIFKCFWPQLWPKSAAL